MLFRALAPERSNVKSNAELFFTKEQNLNKLCCIKIKRLVLNNLKVGSVVNSKFSFNNDNEYFIWNRTIC